MEENSAMELASSRIIGTGEMSDLVRVYDWGSTPLGPIEAWSKELVTIVNLTLASSSPARTMWGPQLILIYNDAYRPIPGPRHPFALGRPAREVYSESWHVVGPLLEQALATGKTVFHEKLLVPLPTEVGLRDAYLNYSFTPIFEDSAIAGLFGSLHDVTGEVVAVRKLAQSEARASRILQSIGDAVIVTDEHGAITDMNHVAESLTGWTLDGARGELLSTVFHIVDEERREPVESPADKVRRLGTIVGLANHTILIRKDGTETAIDDSGAPVWDNDGKLTGIVLVFRDITERKLAEKATLRERTRALEVLQQAPVFFALLQGPDHVISMVNPLYLRLVNYRDVLNKPVRIALPDAAEQGYIEILDKVYQGEPFVGTGLRYQVYAGEGLPADDRYVDFVYQPLREADGHVSGIIVVGVDVTDRKKAQDALLRLAAIVDSSDDVILSKDLNGIVTSWNVAASRLFGYPAEEMIGASILKLIPEHLHSDEKIIIDHIRAGRRLEHFETERMTKDGRLVEVSLTISPVKDEQGSVIGASKILRDISARKQMEQKQRELAKHAAELAAIVDSSDDVILSKDLDGTIKSWNSAASRLFGYSAEEMIGQSILKLIPEDLRDEERRIIETIRAGQRVERFDTVRLTKDGRLVEVSLTVSPIKDDQDRVIGASKILHDISDRKRMEQSLLQAEKIAATGRMAATIAHEINNPLEAVVNLLYLLRSKISDEDGLNYLSNAEAELGRVSHIAKQTLGYYREHAAATPASLSEIAQHAVAIYAPRCAAVGINISTSFQSSRKATLRRGEMMQVISNLIANSIYAMPNGGRLSVFVENADEPVSGMQLIISDDGVGIAPRDLPRVFEAFFTTRSTVGTGIGLFVAKQFIEGHGGQISITSQNDEKNHGTTVRIFMPLHTPYDASPNP
jgi:PAS domain S-box-containing protein